MKIYKVLLFVLPIMLFIGCSTHEIRKEVVEVVDTVEVSKPVPCKVDNFTCDFTGDLYTPTYKLLTCVIIQKRIIEICSGKNSSIPVNSSTEKIQDYIDKQLKEIESEFSLKDSQKPRR